MRFKCDVCLQTVSSLKIQKAEVHALYRCLASNKLGRDVRIILFRVTRMFETLLSCRGKLDSDLFYPVNQNTS